MNNIGLEKFLPSLLYKTEVDSEGTILLRFEEKKDKYVWVHTDEICFVISADHYIKALIKTGSKKKWMSRHCTLKELLHILPQGNFIRLNKFYVLNLDHFSHIDEKNTLLYFNDNICIPIPHRISPYLRKYLKAPIHEPVISSI